MANSAINNVEGCPVSLFSDQQREQIISLFLAFNAYYPAQSYSIAVRSSRSIFHQPTLPGSARLAKKIHSTTGYTAQ
jgi:hypothetical protein